MDDGIGCSEFTVYVANGVGIVVVVVVCVVVVVVVGVEVVVVNGVVFDGAIVNGSIPPPGGGVLLTPPIGQLSLLCYEWQHSTSI